MADNCGIKRGCIGVYGKRTRALQRCISAEAFGLTFKSGMFYLYLGDASNVSPDINDVGNPVLMEVPDRAFSDTPVEVNIGMDPMMEGKADYSRYGYIDPIGNEHLFRIHVDDFECLGRPPIIGDVFEIPFFSRDDKKALWEVTDVDRKTEYEKFYCVIHATPLGKSRKTVNIPVDRDNEDGLLDIMHDVENQQTEQVPVVDPTLEDSPVPEEVDYRDEEDVSFLDDPTRLL